MLRTNVKFSCLAASTVPAAGLPSPLPLAPDVWAELPSGLDLSVWKETLGTEQIDQIANATLWLWHAAPSARLEVYDSENVELANRMFGLWRALLINRAPAIKSAWVLTGAIRADGYVQVRSLKKCDIVYSKERGQEPALDRDKAVQVADCAARLLNLEAAGSIQRRLERGFASLLSATRAAYIDEAILSLVRALEGILHPNNREQFSKRAATVVDLHGYGDGERLKFFENLYDVRSGFTHAETLEEVFPGATPEEAQTLGFRLQIATYLIVTRAYTAVFSSPELSRTLSSGSMGEFWGQVVAGKRPPPFVVRLDDSEWRTADPPRAG